jgi:hypothetical protein
VLDINFAKETDEGKLVFVGIHYDKLPEGVKIAFVPFRVTDATTGEDLPDSADIVKQLTSLKQQGSVMFIDNSLTQKKALDVTAIVPPLKNIKQFKAMLDSKKRDQAAEVKAALEPVKLELEKAIINDPNIIGKDLLGKDYEGIVINSRLGPIKITSQEQRDVISAKNAAKVSARTERPRNNQNKTAVVAIGSFAGHAGHQELFKLTIDKANEVGGDPYLFMGNAVGKDDPIPIADKVKTWQMLYPQYSKNISAVTMEGGSIMQKVKHELINPLKGQPPRYDNIIIMVGEDQAKMNIAQALMKAVNKFQGYEHVKAELEVTPRGTGISFTNLRNALKTQTPEKAFAIWSKAFYNPDAGAKELPAEWIEHLMDVSRKGMGIDISPEPKPQVPQKQPVEQPMAEETGPMDTPLRRFMIKQIARITGRNDLENLDDNEIEDLFAKYVPGSEKKIEKFNHAMQEFSTMEYQDRMAGVGMGNYVVDETKRMSAAVKLQRAWDRERAKSSASYERERMRRELQGIADRMKPREEPKKDDQTNEKLAPASQFAGSDKNPINGKGMARKQKAPLTGLLVGEEQVDEKIKGVDGKACWKGKRYAGRVKKADGTYKDKCIPVGEGWEEVMANAVDKLLENFANGKNPGRKGLSKRLHINTKGQSAAEIERRAKKATGERKTMLHFAANMKKGHAKKK